MERIFKNAFIMTFLAVIGISAQKMPNFDFTTMDGKTYNLYNDFLNQKRPVIFHTTTSS